MELLPIRSGLDEQILDKISGYISPELQNKIDFCKKNIDKIIRINGDKIYNPEIIKEDIFYFLRKESKTRYWYPIQYAKIIFIE